MCHNIMRSIKSHFDFNYIIIDYRYQPQVNFPYYQIKIREMLYPRYFYNKL